MIPIKQKKTLSIQYGYGKCGTCARVMSQSLAHGNSMNKIRLSQNKARREEHVGGGGKHETVQTIQLQLGPTVPTRSPTTNK